MKLIYEKEVEKAAMSDRWFESIGTPSSDYQLGFIVGSNYTQQKLIPLMIEFADWCLYNFHEPKTIDKQLLEQFIKTKQK